MKKNLRAKIKFDHENQKHISLFFRIDKFGHSID